MYRNLILIIVFAYIAVPSSDAQFREGIPSEFPQTRLYSPSGKIGSVLNAIFNPSVFQMSHSFEMSAGSFGGNGYSMGMYTNTLSWKFSPKLAARMDIAVAYSPQSQFSQNSGFANQSPRVFLRNAEVAWKPSDRFQLNIQIRQNPYAYHGLMGYGPYGYHRRHMGFHDRNFWF